MFLIPAFSSNLSTNKIGHNIKYLESIDSTNTEIYRMFKNNEAQSGDIVITDNQNSGRGRRGDSWYSQPNKSITTSFIIKNNYNNLDKKLPLLIGIAIIKGIQQSTKILCDLKWPNDIMYQSKKIGGVLIEKKDNPYIIGLGLNINETKFEKSIQDSTMSLKLILNRTIERESLLAYIINHFEILLDKSLDSIINLWESFCGHLNQTVYFHDSKKLIDGKFLGLNKNGEANIKIGGQEIKSIHSGVIKL